MLNNITAVTNLSDVSTPTIGSLVLKVYKEVSEDLGTPPLTGDYAIPALLGVHYR